MKYLEILRAKLDELAEARSAGYARMEAVTAAAETETRSELTEAEEAEFVEARDAVAAVDAELVSVRSRIAELEAIEAGREAADEVQRSSGGFTPPNISRGRDPWSTDEVRFGETSRSQLHGQVRAALDTMDELRADEKEAAAGLLANYDTKRGTLARRMLITGAPAYRSMFEKALDGNSMSFTDVERAKYTEMRAASLTDAAGGYAVPFDATGFAGEHVDADVVPRPVAVVAVPIGNGGDGEADKRGRQRYSPIRNDLIADVSRHSRGSG